MYAWNTFRELDRLRDELDHVFERQFGRIGDSRNRAAFLPGYSARRYPMVNLYEDNEHFIVEALAPGIDPQKLNVTVIGNVLTFSGEKSPINGGVKPEAFHRNERAAGKFVRSVELPMEVDADKVEAEYRHGILTVTLPKTEKARPRTITVKAN